MTELKPCPFCGGEAKIMRAVASWVQCLECGTASDNSASDDDAIAAWNRRDEGWRPIETAPRDGTRVLGYYPDIEDSYQDTAYLERHGCWAGAYGKQPTHWMPLPAPPESTITPDLKGEEA